MIRGRIIPYAEARALKARNPRARWPSVADSLKGEAWPQLHPSFRIRSGQTIFTIGSCFARNIERHLTALGCHVPMADFHLPPHEFHGAANGAMNKFHPPSFRQSLGWTAAIHDRDGKVTWADCAPMAYGFGDGRYFDLDIGATGAVTQERFIDRRQHIYDIFASVFTADCLMMTPGLIEAWRDRATGFYMHEPPTQKAMLADRDRWELEILSYEQCLQDLLAAIDTVRARNPGIKVLVTTSPVPMAATFSGQDILVANAESKAVLRAVCGTVTRLRPMTDYFPSYESATLSNPVGVWEPDRLHVASGFVGKIVSHMLDSYLEGVDGAARAYQRAKTLLHDRGYEAAVEAAREAVAINPRHTEARIVLAEALVRLYRCAEAEAELKALLQTEPDRSDLWILLARAITRSEDGGRRAQEAVRHIETGLGLPSVTVSDFRAVAGTVRQHAPPELAERLMRRGVELFPLHIEAYPPLFDVLMDQQRRPEAIELLRRAATLRRVPLSLYVQLAELLADAGEAQEALAVVNRALALDPQDRAALELRARLERTAAPA